MGLKPFVSKNLVAIVTIPMIIGAHYGWYKLQGIESLVSPEEKRKLPFAKHIENLNFFSSSKE